MPRYSGELAPSWTPSYEGVDMEFDPESESRYKDFLALDPGDWYEEAVAGPETKRFKEELLPIIKPQKSILFSQIWLFLAPQ